MLQQSALDAHAVPAGGGFAAQSTPVVARQRGIPRLSCTQFVFTCCTVPEQQRSVAWQENAERRQIEPAGLHLLPWSHRPTIAPAALLQVVFVSEPSGRPAEPQQSLSCWQSSPVGWQPLGGWQMFTPVAAYGSHERLQHGFVLHAPPGPHTVPAVVQPPAPAAAATPHVPSVAPAVFVQTPPQQSRSPEHASPFCVQNDASAAQIPLWQSDEQQSPLPAHGLPDVLHVVLSGVHVPPAPHLPPQHWPSAVHAALSAAHCLSEHVPPVHEKVQHWSFVVHADAGAPHLPRGVPHSFVAGSQLPVQQSALVVHAAAACLHEGLTRGSPSLATPPSFAAPPAPSVPESLPHPVKTTVASTVGTTTARAASESLFMGITIERKDAPSMRISLVE